jgi:hypothetical protein
MVEPEKILEPKQLVDGEEGEGMEKKSTQRPFWEALSPAVIIRYDSCLEVAGFPISR